MTTDWQRLTRSELSRLIEKMSGKQIGHKFGVTPEAVYYRLRTWGIFNSKRQKRARSFDPPIAELAELYQRLSMAEIAKHYGVGETIVFTRLKEHGIKGPTRSERLKGHKKTPEHRMALSRAHTGKQVGDKNPNWRGGKSTRNKLGRSRGEFHRWRAAVFENANWLCQGCGKEQGSLCGSCGHRIRLHAHHIKEYAKHPELRYEVSNGKALCERCHFMEHHKQSG